MSTILVAEDNEMNRDMLSRVLRRAGYEVVTAPDGRAAIDCTRREDPDLILMDLGLPEVDGWGATRSIRDEPATRHIPIIAVSAHAFGGDESRALAAGCDDFEAKPLDLPRLLAKIDRWLSHSEPPRT